MRRPPPRSTLDRASAASDVYKRQPLGRIRILTELARDGVDIDKQLDNLDREVVEMDALVGDLLASSRLDFTALARVPVDPVDAAQRLSLIPISEPTRPY